MRKLNSQNGRLDFVEPKVTADEMMVVTGFHSMLSANAKSLCQLLFPAGNHASVSGCSEIFGWIKTEKPALPHRPGLLDLRIEPVFGADCLGGVFNHLQSILFRDAMHRIHIAAQTKEMNRDNRTNDRASFANNHALCFLLAFMFKK